MTGRLYVLIGFGAALTALDLAHLEMWCHLWACIALIFFGAVLGVVVDEIRDLKKKSGAQPPTGGEH